MKKYFLIVAFAAIAGVSFGQLKSSVIKNTAGTEVFSINYGSGVATVAVNNVISAGSIVLTGAAAVAPTNSASAGLSITVNGTNYVIALYPN
jgi:hypothetical protein